MHLIVVLLVLDAYIVYNNNNADHKTSDTMSKTHHSSFTSLKTLKYASAKDS